MFILHPSAYPTRNRSPRNIASLLKSAALVRSNAGPATGWQGGGSRDARKNPVAAAPIGCAARRQLKRREFRPLEPQPIIRTIHEEPVEIFPSRPSVPPPRLWPRRVLVTLLLAAMVSFSAIPIANQLLHPPGDNKDYDIWYKAGREILEGSSLYSERELAGKRVFEFMYPPAAAVFLAPLTACGKLPFIVLLDVLNSVSWIASLLLSVKLCRRPGVRPPITAYLLPALCTIAYVYDAYLLGQPNLMLLACLLSAFAALREKRDITAGALMAFATACKAFPALSLGYLVYRRQWRAALAMVAFLALFLVVVPAPVRGLSRTVQELKTWTSGMLFRYDGNAISQRPARRTSGRMHRSWPAHTACCGMCRPKIRTR